MYKRGKVQLIMAGEWRFVRSYPVWKIKTFPCVSLNLIYLCIDITVFRWLHQSDTLTLTLICRNENQTKLYCIYCVWLKSLCVFILLITMQIHCSAADKGSRFLSKWQTRSGMQVIFFPSSRCFHAINLLQCRSMSSGDFRPLKSYYITVFICCGT